MMRLFNSIEDIIEGTKLLQPKDYTYVQYIDFIRDGVPKMNKTVFKVFDKDDNNIGGIYDSTPPRYEEDESNWEPIFVVQFTTNQGASYQYRYSKKNFVLSEKLVSSKNGNWAHRFDAMGYGGYNLKKHVSKDTLGTFKDFMNEL